MRRAAPPPGRRALPQLALLASLALAAPPSAPAPSAALSLFVGFASGSCWPPGADHADAALYAGSFALGGKGGCGGHAPAWRLSEPGAQFTLASSQLAGATNLLGTDPASGVAWGTWLLGQAGGGPPYRQMVTQITSAAASGKAPAVGWTCRPPRGAFGVPFFDRRVARASPLYYSNGSFVVYGDPAAVDTDDEEDASWVIGGRWDRGSGSGGGVGVAIPPLPHLESGAALLAELERLAPGTFVSRERAENGGLRAVGDRAGSAAAAAAALAAAGVEAAPPPRRPRGASPEDAPNCTVKTLGAYALPAPGVQRALVFDATFSTPSAVTLTLERGAVTVQRLSVLTGKPLSAPARISCALCGDYLYSPTLVANGVAVFGTINYTTSVITTFTGPLSGKSFAPVAGSSTFVLRESDALALPTAAGGKGGGAAPFPLGLAALQFSTPSSSWACSNKSATRTLSVGAVARAGAPVSARLECSVPLCAMPTDDGGCIVPIISFV